jgi:hypothetical protein
MLYRTVGEKLTKILDVRTSSIIRVMIPWPNPFCVEGINLKMAVFRDAVPFDLVDIYRHFVTMMMETESFSETSVRTNRATQCYTPDDSHLHTCRRENLAEFNSVPALWQRKSNTRAKAKLDWSVLLPAILNKKKKDLRKRISKKDDGGSCFVQSLPEVVTEG